MTYQERRELYESIIQDVAKVVKKKLNEFDINYLTTFDIRDFSKNYQLIFFHIEELENDLIHQKLNESLPNDFNEKDAKLLLDELKDWLSTEKDSYIEYEKYNFIERVDCYLLPNDSKIQTIILNNRKSVYLKIIDDYMEEHDYQPIMTKSNGVHIIRIYENKIPTEVDFNSHKNFKGYLYHITPEENVESIKQNGLILRSRSNVSGITYDKRIYFFLDESVADEYHYSVQKENDVTRVVKIKIPYDSVSHLNFYYDPLLAASVGIYTTEDTGVIEDLKIEYYLSQEEEEELKNKESEEVFKNLRMELSKK